MPRDNEFHLQIAELCSWQAHFRKELTWPLGVMLWINKSVWMEAWQMLDKKWSSKSVIADAQQMLLMGILKRRAPIQVKFWSWLDLKCYGLNYWSLMFPIPIQVFLNQKRLNMLTWAWTACIKMYLMNETLWNLPFFFSSLLTIIALFKCTMYVAVCAGENLPQNLYQKNRN